MAISVLTDTTSKAIDNKEHVIGLLFYFAKAFDIAYHNIVLRKWLHTRMDS